MLVLPNLILIRFSAISVKIPASYIVDINKVILKFIWKGKNIQNTQLSIKGEQPSWRTDTTHKYSDKYLTIKLVKMV